MPSFWSTTYTSAKLEIAISTNGSHQLALRRMSVNVLRGATKVSTTRSTSESGGCSSGGAAAAELIGSPPRERDAARLYHQAVGQHTPFTAKPDCAVISVSQVLVLSRHPAQASTPTST